MNWIHQNSIDVNTKLGWLNDQYLMLRSDIDEIKSKFATHDDLMKLEERISTLEQNGVASPDLTFFKRQLDALDPAQKCLGVIGLKSSDVATCSTEIQQFFQTHFNTLASSLHIEHIMKGPANDKKLGQVALVHFSSKSTKDSTLKLIIDQKLEFKDSTGHVCKIDHAKTKRQLHRNWAVRKAEELLKKEVNQSAMSRSSGKTQM